MVIYSAVSYLFVFQRDLSPLHMAVMGSGLDIAELLIRSGADVHARDEVSTDLIQSSFLYVTVFVVIITLDVDNRYWFSYII